jgi:hypothetical protein
MSTRFGGVGEWRVRSNSAVFHAAEIAAAMMLLFFRELAPMDILTKRDNLGFALRVSMRV